MLSAFGPINISIHHLTLKNGAHGEGSALYVQRGTITISNSVFENNLALFGSGGAIWLRRGTMTITTSRFQGNSAHERGGAIWIGTGEMMVEDSMFITNQAPNGGAIYAQNSSLTITHSAFVKNAALIDEADPYNEAGGGAIFADQQIVTVTNSTFSKNTAVLNSNERRSNEGKGGGILTVAGDIVLFNSTFTQNEAFIGGALYTKEGVIRSVQSIIANNQAQQQGADIPFDTRFESGGYNLIGDDEGGRLVVATSDIVNQDPYLETDSYGLPQLATVSPANNVIPPNECATTEDQHHTARPQGTGCDIGAIEMVANIETAIPPTPSPTTSAGPTDKHIACDETALRDAIVQGGSISLPKNCTILLTDDLPEVTASLVLNGNGAVLDGANTYRLFHSPVEADLTLRNLTLQNGRDPGIWISRGNVSIEYVTLRNNDGGIYAGSGSVAAVDCVISDNTAETGAAIYVYNGPLVLTRCEIEANESTDAGGAIWAMGGPVTIENSIFYDNISQNSSGGAVFVERGPVEIRNSTLRGNLANQGGAVAIGTGSVTIADSMFAGNHGGPEGGAVYADSGQITVSRTLFEANSAGHGGGIFTKQGQILVTGSQFNQNWSWSEGGGIAGELYTGITVTDCVFRGNISGSGGGIGTSGWVQITSSLFYGNSAREGGAVTSWSRMTVTASTVVHNTAEKEGGGLYPQNGLILQQSIVANNQAGANPDIVIPYVLAAPSSGYNLIGQPSLLVTVDTDIVGKDPGLIFGENSFYTLNADSPVLDAIPLNQCATKTDQRGQARPAGTSCDIGALEMGETAELSLPNLPAPIEVTCDENSLIEALHRGGDIHLASGCVYTLTRDLPFVTINTVINGDGAVIDGGERYRLLSSPANANISVRDLTLQNGVTDVSGGAIFANSGSVTVDRCLIAHNSALRQGGGIYAGGLLNITHSVIIYNQANEAGGGASTASYAIIVNSTFAYNISALGGGGLSVSLVYGYISFTPEGEPKPGTFIDYSTFAFNTTSRRGGGALVGGQLSIQNSIISNNYAEEFADLDSSSNPYIFHSLGYNVLGPNPRLSFAPTDVIATDAKFDQFTGMYLPLLPTSPALDHIPASACGLDLDQRGTARPQGPNCDAGAVEMEQSAAFIPIPSTPTPIPPPPPALICSEESLKLAVSLGGSFTLPPGCVIILTNNLPPVTSDFTLSSSASIIDGAHQYHIFSAVGLADITLQGLTLRNAFSVRGSGLSAENGDISLTNCVLQDNTAVDKGGGLYAGYGRIIISDSVIQRNTAAGEYGSGGGIYVQGGDLYVTNSQILENKALGSSGGGINIESGYATITNSVFAGNTARKGGGLGSQGFATISVYDSHFEHNTATGQSESNGGGLYASSGPVLVESSVFIGNTALTGGGLFTAEGYATITNSTFYANEAIHEKFGSGGALSGYNSTVTLLYCTLVENHAVSQAGGISIRSGTLEMGGTIMAGNTANMYPELTVSDRAFISLGYNLLETSVNELPFADTDMIADTQLESFETNTGIFLLSPNSPALDAVPPDQCMIDQDQRGVNRPQGQACDIGAVEMIQ